MIFCLCVGDCALRKKMHVCEGCMMVKQALCSQLGAFMVTIFHQCKGFRLKKNMNPLYILAKMVTLRIQVLNYCQGTCVALTHSSQLYLEHNCAAVACCNRPIMNMNLCLHVDHLSMYWICTVKPACASLMIKQKQDFCGRHVSPVTWTSPPPSSRIATQTNDSKIHCRGNKHKEAPTL